MPGKLKTLIQLVIQYPVSKLVKTRFDTCLSITEYFNTNILILYPRHMDTLYNESKLNSVFHVLII